MADYTTATGTINLWIRSTDARADCEMQYLLTRLYGPSEDAGYFFTGTALHAVFEEMLTNPDIDTSYMTDKAVTMVEEMVAESEAAGRTVRWTKKRPEDGMADHIQEMVEAFFYDVVARGTALTEYRGMTVYGAEVETNTPWPVVQTEVDAVLYYPDGDYYAIVDWKTGATAKADDRQLWIYKWALRQPGNLLADVPAERVATWFHHTAFSKTQLVDNYPGDAYMMAWMDSVYEKRSAMCGTGFAEAKPDWYCNYCLVQDRCPVMGEGTFTDIKRAAIMAPTEQRKEAH